MTTSGQHPETISEHNAEFAKIRVRLQAIRLAARNVPVAVRSLSRRVTLGAPPQTVYNTLLDAQKLSTITGMSASIQPEIAGELVLDNGHVVGLVSELLEPRHLAVALHFDEQNWPENHYSTATFMLNAAKEGTQVVFFEQDVPEDAYDAVSRWWEEHLWTKLPAAFGG